jgi:hypothetical protein
MFQKLALQKPWSAARRKDKTKPSLLLEARRRFEGNKKAFYQA